MASAKMKRLWRQPDTSPKLKVRTYCASVSSVLFYGCGTWSMRARDVRWPEVFDH